MQILIYRMPVTVEPIPVMPEQANKAKKPKHFSQKFKPGYSKFKPTYSKINTKYDYNDVSTQDGGWVFVPRNSGLLNNGYQPQVVQFHGTSMQQRPLPPIPKAPRPAPALPTGGHPRPRAPTPRPATPVSVTIRTGLDTVGTGTRPDGYGPKITTGPNCQTGNPESSYMQWQPGQSGTLAAGWIPTEKQIPQSTASGSGHPVGTDQPESYLNGEPTLSPGYSHVHMAQPQPETSASAFTSYARNCESTSKTALATAERRCPAAPSRQWEGLHLHCLARAYIRDAKKFMSQGAQKDLEKAIARLQSEQCALEEENDKERLAKYCTQIIKAAIHNVALNNPLLSSTECQVLHQVKEQTETLAEKYSRMMQSSATYV